MGQLLAHGVMFVIWTGIAAWCETPAERGFNASVAAVNLPLWLLALKNYTP